jgi:stage II sporulation protein R
LTEETYPTRDYESFSLPAGTYLSLRVLIGEAAGQNWWCVMYPPLCLETATDTPIGLDDAEWGLMTENGGGRYTVKFRILELLQACFA